MFLVLLTLENYHTGDIFFNLKATLYVRLDKWIQLMSWYGFLSAINLWGLILGEKKYAPSIAS